MHQAVQRCAPKPVLSTYPSAIAALPPVQTAQHAPQNARRLTTSPDMLQPAQSSMAPSLTHTIRRTLRTVVAARRSNVDHECCDGGSGNNSSSSQRLAAARAAMAQLGSARALSSNPEEVPIIRVCTGDFSGGPNKGVFRFAGELFPPHGRAVLVPFAAGATCMPKHTQCRPEGFGQSVSGLLSEGCAAARACPYLVRFALMCPICLVKVFLNRPTNPSVEPAAGFMFASGLVLDEVPFDPELPFLFDGEEVSNADNDYQAATTMLPMLSCAFMPRSQTAALWLWLCNAVPVQHASLHSRLGRVHADRECSVSPLCPICATTSCNAYMLHFQHI
jgi:Glycosyltransferase (GlcNAc)